MNLSKIKLITYIYIRSFPYFAEKIALNLRITSRTTERRQIHHIAMSNQIREIMMYFDVTKHHVMSREAM